MEEARQPMPPFKPAKYGLNERQVADYVKTSTAKNIWYYRCVAIRCAAALGGAAHLSMPPADASLYVSHRDRLSTPRGPCSLPVMREAWVNGVIDENTLVWGQGLADWLPVKNVRTLVPQIRTVEVQVATWVKKTFALRPALNKARKARAEQRPEQNNQIDDMY